MFKKLDLKTTYSPKKTSTISLRKGSHNLVQTQTPAIPSLQKNSYFLKQNFNKPTQLSLKGKKREIYPGQSINLSLPTTKNESMLDINEKNSHSDQIIFNKSVIEQHLKTHFTKERNNWTSPNVDKQTLSSNKTNVINAFTFEEPERKNSSYFNCHKNLNVKLDKSFSDKNSFSPKNILNLTPKTVASEGISLFSSKKKNQNQTNLPNKSDLTPFDFLNATQQNKSKPVLSFRYSTRTKKGLLSNNPKKFNQDNFIAIPDFNSECDSHLFSVCDGHGENGHLVSYFLKENFPKILLKNLNTQNPISSVLFNSVSEVESNLASSKIDVSLSGSTMIILFIHKNTIYICNVGDSRAILGQTSSEKGKSLWKAIALSQDHKPELSKEKERIENKGGLVVLRKHSEKSQEPVRAWIPHNKAFGLSMSRSLGDLIAKKYGITWEPEIRKVEIGDSDKFLIIGSDGVWEIIENQECVELVGGYYGMNEIERVADVLMEEVTKRWVF